MEYFYTIYFSTGRVVFRLKPHMVILGMSRTCLGVLFGVIDGRLMEDLVHLFDIRPETGLPYQEPMGALIDDLLLVASLVAGVDGGETIVGDEKGLVTRKGILDEGIEGGGVVGFPRGKVDGGRVGFQVFTGQLGRYGEVHHTVPLDTGPREFGGELVDGQEQTPIALPQFHDVFTAGFLVVFEDEEGMIDVSEVDGATIQQFHVTHGEDGLDGTPILVIGVDVLADVLKGDVGELGLDPFQIFGPMFTGQVFQDGGVVGVVLELNLFDILVQEVGDKFLVNGVGWYRDKGGHGVVGTGDGGWGREGVVRGMLG
jgi:hypothetical protein